ncbi:MAG: hypothetical protein V4739_03570 [Pseudomonadota bacterium]
MTFPHPAKAKRLLDKNRKLNDDLVVQGHPVARFGGGMTMVRTGEATQSAVPLGDQATVLVTKAGRALKKPGIDRSVIFRSQAGNDVFSYSVFPGDPSKVVREAADGTVTVGRLVGGKFRAIKAA